MDTGASHSIVRRDLFDRRRVTPLNGIQLRTATGEIAQIIGKVTASIHIGNRTVEHDFIVANITDEVIIGVDFMIRHGFTLDLKKKTLRYANVELPLDIGCGQKLTVARVYISERHRIEPNTEEIIWATSEDCGTSHLWVVEADKKNLKKDLIIGKTLVKTRVDSKIPVRILNPTNEPKWIQKGELIAQCEKVTAVINCENDQQDTKGTTLTKSSALEVLTKEWTKELSAQNKNKAKRFLQKHWRIFASKGENNGRTSVVKHRIDTGNFQPIRQPPRRLALAKREEVTGLIEDMAREKVIAPSESPWSSPVVLVKKKDGSMRFCVDYRKLNDVTKKDSYPLPRIDDTLDTLSGATWFSTLDLQSGYWQVEIDEKDKEKTAFSIGNGLWQFNVMPFGLCNAPATFERLMERVLKGLHWRTCLVYLDDIIIMGKDFDDHLKNLEEVFERLEAAGLKLSAKKCSLFQREVKYLGHKVTSEGIHTDEDKIKAVKNWPRPTNLHELRSFLGLCTYYRRFVPGFANVAGSLHELTQKNRKFEWSGAQETAFQKLKELLSTAPILAYPIPGEKFVLDTDASGHGIGGVLSQVVNGQEKVVAYFSKVLSKPERNYCVTRRELLAVMESVKHFHKYLYGQHFLLRTDHAALRWLLQFKDPEGQVARWIERLQSYDFTIEHRKGSQHGNADALSRRPCKIECGHCSRTENKAGTIDVRLLNVLPEEKWTKEEVQRDQRSDTDLATIIKHKELGRKPAWQEISNESQICKAYWAQWQSLELHDGCLYRIWESEDGKIRSKLLVIPKAKFKEIIKDYHNGSSGGHLGITKTTEKIKKRFYWVGCQETVADWIRRCDQCAIAKGPRQRTRGKMHQYNVGAPFERIAMDIAGPFPISNAGNKYILVVIDYFSKWPEVYPIPNQEAKTVADIFIKNWICRYGAPLELHSDQGRNFESTLFKEVCDMLGIQKTRTTALHPQSDGMVERFNRTLEEHLKKVVDKGQKDWDERLPMFLMAYRSSIHDTTTVTPAKAIFGTDLRLPADLKYGVSVVPEMTHADDYISRKREELADIHELIRRRTQLASDKMKARYDLRANTEGFKEGQLVLLHNPQRKRGLSPKLQTHWEGPYRIVTRINDVVYRIQKYPTNKGKLKVVHIERLAPYTRDGDTLVRDEQV